MTSFRWRAAVAGGLTAALVGAGALMTAPAAATAGQDRPPAVPVDDVVEDPAPPEGARVLTREQALARDTAAVAAFTGVPIAQAERRVRFQEAVTRYIESLPPDVAADSFASGRLSFSPGPSAVLYFKGDVPQAARRGVPAGVRLTGGMRFSLDELSVRQNAIHEAVTDLGFREVVSAVDVTTQRVAVDVAVEPGLSALRGAKLRDAVLTSLAGRSARAVASGAAPIRVEAGDLTVAEHPAGARLARPEHGYGGAGIRDDGVRECTSGFVVRRSSDGVEGVLTDSHCEGINQIEENNSSGGVNLTFDAPFVAEHIGVNGDTEFHTTSHDDYPQFWSDNDELRTVTGRIGTNSYVVGGVACHYGRFGGYSCGEIATLLRSVTFTWAGCGCERTAQNLVGTTGATSTGGDSGGPWFLGLEAYGLHWGQAFGERLFSRIQRSENQFGVTVQRG